MSWYVRIFVRQMNELSAVYKDGRETVDNYIVFPSSGLAEYYQR